MIDDTPLWTAYFAAQLDGDIETCRRLAGEIVEMHIGFFKTYAHENGFASWSDDVKEEYLQELYVVALERVPHYRPELGKFISYVRPFLLSVRTKVAAKQLPFATGHESSRLWWTISRQLADAKSHGRPAPTSVEMAEVCSRTHGKVITKERIENLLRTPRVISGDRVASTAEDDGRRLSVFEAAQLRLPAPELGADVERSEIDARVDATLASLDLTEAEQIIVERVFMAPPRRVANGVVMEEGPLPKVRLAVLLGVNQAKASQMQAELAERIRAAGGESVDEQ